MPESMKRLIEENQMSKEELYRFEAYTVGKYNADPWLFSYAMLCKLYADFRGEKKTMTEGIRWIDCEYLVEDDRVRLKEEPEEKGYVISENAMGYVILLDSGDYDTIPADELEVMEA